MSFLQTQKTCLIVDDHPLVCAAIERLISNSGKFTTVIAENNAMKAIKLIKENDIDCLILDVNLEKYDGFELLRRVKSHGYQGKTLFISANDSPLYSDTAIRMGADGYISKAADMSLISDAIDCIMSGYTFFKSYDVSDKKHQTDVQLSKQEMVVFNYLINGKSNKEIAEILSLSSKTISTYKTRILTKYNVSSIIELMQLNQSVV